MATFTTPRGVHIPQAARLKESYEIKFQENNEFTIRANVSAEKIDPIFRASVSRLSEPTYLILETPCNEVREAELRKKPTDRFHRDVFFMHGPTNKRLLKIYEQFQELLIHDGFIHFGIRSCNSDDEVFVGRYKIFTFFGQLPNKFEDVLAEFGLSKTERLITAWDTFTKEAPGKISRYNANGNDIYGMIEDLIQKHGLFHARTLEG